MWAFLAFVEKPHDIDDLTTTPTRRAHRTAPAVLKRTRLQIATLRSFDFEGARRCEIRCGANFVFPMCPLFSQASIPGTPTHSETNY